MVKSARLRASRTMDHITILRDAKNTLLRMSVSVLLHAAQKLVRLRQAMRQAAGVGAVASPIRQFLPAHRLLAARRILPGQAALGVECRDVRQRGTGVFLQAHATAA